MDESHIPQDVGERRTPTAAATVQTTLKQSIVTLAKWAGSTVILITEIAFVGVIGGYVGSYFSAKAIVEDCRRVEMAKVGEAFIRCTIVEPKKDPITAPPR